jgi:hypothetical protein
MTLAVAVKPRFLKLQRYDVFKQSGWTRIAAVCTLYESAQTFSSG